MTRRRRRVLDVRAADLQEEMAEQRFSVPSAPTKTAATQRTSQRAERAIKYSAMREQLQKTGSIVAVARPHFEAPDVCRQCPRRSAGTQKLHPGKDLSGEHKEQGDPQQNRRGG